MDWKTIKKQGFMTKQGGGNSLLGRKNWKKRFFDLRDGLLSYAEQPNEPDLGVIVLKGARLEDVSNAEDGPQICVSVVTPEKRTFLLRAPDTQSHSAWLAVLQRVIDSMKRKTMPESVVEVGEDGIRVFDSLSSQQTAFFKITKLRNWKATQTHLHVCVDVNKQPENHMYRTEHAGTFAKALNKAAKIAAKNPLSISSSGSSADLSAQMRLAPSSPRSPQEYYADEGDNYDAYETRKLKTRSLEPPQRQAKQQAQAQAQAHAQQQQQHAQQDQYGAKTTLHQRSQPEYFDEPISEAPRAPPPADFGGVPALARPPPLAQSSSMAAMDQYRKPAAALSQSMPAPAAAPGAGAGGGERLARALYDYAPKDETRLAMNRGDVLRIVKEIDEHWYRCQLGSKKGIVPRTYVRLMENDIVAKAVADFDDGDEKHLRFDKHETIVVLTRVENSEWWDGAVFTPAGDGGVDENGQPRTYKRIGIFPCTELIVSIVAGQDEFNRLNA